jgi:hypothetical protein
MAVALPPIDPIPRNSESGSGVPTGWDNTQKKGRRPKPMPLANKLVIRRTALRPGGAGRGDNWPHPGGIPMNRAINPPPIRVSGKEIICSPFLNHIAV